MPTQSIKIIEKVLKKVEKRLKNYLSRYLRVKPLKSKYATTTADAFKKMINNKQPKKVWVDAGTEFEGSFSTLFVRKKILKFIKLSAKKSQHSRKEIYDRSQI